jgi:RND family efflux transporter MFP subunit
VATEDQVAARLATLRIERDESGLPRPKPQRTAARRPSAGLIVGPILFVALGVGGFWAFQRGRGEIFPDEVEVGVIGLVSPIQNDVIMVASGYVQTRTKAIIAPKVIGRLARLHVTEGERVHKGMLVAEMETADPQAQLAQVSAEVLAAEARVERAKAALSEASAKLEREEQLSARGAGTPSSLQEARFGVTAINAQIAADDAEVRAVAAKRQVIGAQLEGAKLRAPFDGTIIRKLADVGEMLTPNGAGVLLLASLDDLEVLADVSESHYGKVKVGTPAEILLDAFPQTRFRGRVTDIRQQVDRAKATVTVKVRFVDRSPNVLPDMAAKVSFLAHALGDSELAAAPKLVSPADAVVDRGGHKVVFTLEGDRAREQIVSLVSDSASDGLLEIVRGPAAGTHVVRFPSPRLRDGTLVKEKHR